jgi:hypothetical protein
MSASVFKIESTGAGLIADSYTVTEPGAYRILSVAINFLAAPTTSENLTITLDDKLGEQYDVLLYTLDPSAAATTDILWQPSEELMVVTGDEVRVNFANSDANVFGVVFTVKRV